MTRGQRKQKPAATPAASAVTVRNRVVGLRTVLASSLQPNASNWRLHPEAQRSALGGLLREVGYASALVARELPDGTLQLLDGHLRRDLTPDAEVPVLIVDLDDREANLVLATLDPVSRMAETDAAAAIALLDSIAGTDASVMALLETLRAESAALLPRPATGDPDAVPETPAEAVSKRGEVYELGPHRVMCGDATVAADVATTLGGALPLLLCTDPPYGVSLDLTWRDGIDNAMGSAEKPYMRIEGNRNVTMSGDTIADWSPAFELVPSTVIAYVWHASRYAPEVHAGLERIGFDVLQQIIWDKELFAMGRQTYHWRHEPCWYARRKGHTIPFYGERNQSTVWVARSPKMIMGGSDEDKLDHPAQKPALLYARPIENHLRRGEACYDPFLGSGTAVVAAEQLGRVCYGMEIEPRYVDVIRQRYADFVGDPQWSPRGTLTER